MSEVIPCFAQKSSISCVSGMPPISEPASALLPPITENACRGTGSEGTPTTTITPFIRTRFGINANGWTGVGALLLLLFWWALDETDQIMGGYFFLWLFALMVQKARTLALIKKGERIHSRYWGDPWLAMKIPLVHSQRTAIIAVEPAICLLAGVVMSSVSEPLGTLWMIGFVTLPLRNAIEHAATEARLQSMDDAEIEGRYYAELRKQRWGE